MLYVIPVYKEVKLCFFPTGTSFLSLSSDIEAAYKEYLTNYNNTSSVENSYKQKAALWNEMIRVIRASAYVQSISLPPIRSKAPKTENKQ